MVLGVDVGGTKVAVAAVDGVTVREATEDPHPHGHARSALLDGIEAGVRRVIEKVGEPEAIGVGVPSQIEFATGTVETSVNIPLAGVPLREELGRRFGVPVFVDNDANCAALAEAHMLGEDHLVMLTLGTGVGGGVVIGGKTFRGAHGLGAELGHVTLNRRRPALPGQLPQPRLPRGLLLGPGARARRHRAGAGQARQPAGAGASAPTAGSRAATWSRPPRSGDPDALLIFEQLRAHAGRGDRRLRERVRARAG